MDATIALIVIELFITFMFAPARISVTLYASLTRMRAAADVRVFSLRILRVRLKRKDGAFKLTVNGKRPKKRKIDGGKLISLPKKASEAGILPKCRALARIGLGDARDSALAGGLFAATLASFRSNCAAYACVNEELEFELLLDVRVNLVQIAELAL